MSRKILSLTLSISLLFQYSGFAQSINLADYLSQGHNVVALDRFRPLALRYFSYEPSADNFRILLDKGDQKDLSDSKIKNEADKLLTYFKIGLTLPNEKFWVNLRPDAADQIIDPELEKTDLGKVLLEADLQLKKDTSSLTSPQSKEGKIYWDKLYKKAGELFGTENITIPTVTRPWIVPGEIIVRESKDSAYIYKAVLKVMLEEDYLNNQKTEKPKNPALPAGRQKTDDYNFSDPRLKELNKYSTELIKETILPELTKRINSSRDYANLRQVFFSLILARWFKDTFGSSGSARAPEHQSQENSYIRLIDSGNLNNLTSKEAWSKTAYFNEYKKSFKDGEYNLSESIYTPTGQVIRRYMSGGMRISPTLKANGAGTYGGPDNIVSSAITDRATRVFFTKKELNERQFINSRKRVSAIFLPIYSNLFRLTEAAKNFNEILGTNKSFLTEEETVSIDNLLRRIRENKEQVDAIKNELTGVPEGAVEPLTSLGAAWTTLNRTQVFLIDEAKNLLKIINSIQAMMDYQKVKYLDSIKDNLSAIIKDLSGQVLLIKEIYSEKDTLIESLGNLKKTTVMVDAQCVLSYVDGHTNDTNIGIEFNKNGDILLFSKDDTLGKQPIFKFKLDWDKPKEIETKNYFWKLKINDLSPEGAYNLVGAIKEALERANNASSAVEASKETEGPAIISAVKSLQDELPDDGNEQLLKFIANVNPNNGELEYPIKKDDPVMIGHVRGDRAWYLARGLQEMSFDKLLGYIKFNKDFKGVSVLPEEAVGKISNTFFEIISNLGYTSVKISEDEKKEHTGYNANGRNEQPFPGERRVVIKMQKSSKAYVDTPEMRMKEVADAVLTELDGKVDFILTNFLSSDMMKHTGNFEAAKKSNEITDRQLGRIKEKIDAIKGEIIERIKDEISKYFPEPEEIIYLSNLLTIDYDELLRKVLEKNTEAYNAIKSLERQVPLFVITADHGASEEGLKENPKESDNFHSANPVPYIIYDPLRKQKIPLKEGKTIRNNAATLLQLLGEKIPQEYDESLLPADYQGSKRRIAFAVLDGWGINPDQNYPYDAIRLADTPNYDWFVENTSFTKLQAHGEVIGLRKILSYEEGPHHLRGLQAGQTDIGHIHLFSGREVKQPIWYIDQLIKGGLSNGVFDETKEEVKSLIRELNKVKEKGLKFHYITIGSEGGVHASLYHMYALMRLAKKVGLAKDQFVIYFGACGRDVPTRTAHLYLQDVYKRIEEIGIGVISVVFGRDMLVRKEGAENITNRLIDVLSGDNLKGDDVTLVKEIHRGQTTTGSPLTVEILKQIEWNYIALDSFKEILEEQFEKIQESHGKLFVIDNFWKRFNEERNGNQKIQAIRDAIAVSTPETAESSEIKEANKNELREFIFGGLRSYYRKISQEIKAYLSTVDVSENADLKNKRKAILAEIKDIEDYSHKKEGHSDYFRDKKIVFQLNMAAHIWKMMQEKAPLSNILEQSLSMASSSLKIDQEKVKKVKEEIVADYAYQDIILDDYGREIIGKYVEGNFGLDSAIGEIVRTNLYVKDKIQLKRKLIAGILVVKNKSFSLSRKRTNYSTYRGGIEAALESPYEDNGNGVLEGAAYITYEFHHEIDRERLTGILIEARKMYFAKEASSSLTSTLGGIDFRQMNMLIQPQGSFASSSLDFSLPALSRAEIESFDLDKELDLIQRMASSGIDPIDERFKKYLAVCFARGKVGKEIDDLKLCLEDVFTAQQLDARETPDGYKEVIVIADTRRYVLKESRLAASSGERINLN